MPNDQTSDQNASAVENVIVTVSSDQDDTGSTCFRGAILILDDQLKAKIEKAYKIVLEDDSFDQVSVHCSAEAIAGFDHSNFTQAGLSEDEEEAITQILTSLEDEGGRIGDEAEIASFSRGIGFGVGKTIILVTKYGAPRLSLFEKYSYESFTSPGIQMLCPPSMLEFQSASRSQNERFQNELDAHLASASGPLLSS